MIDRNARRLSFFLAVTFACFLSSVPGCTTVSATGDDLTVEQKAAIDEVVGEITSVSSVLASFMDLVDPQTFVAGDSFGDCPEVTAEATQTDLTVTFDYGDGCTNGLYGDSVVSGHITGTLAIVAQTVTLEFVDFSIGGEPITGSIAIALDGEGSAITLTGDIDIATGDDGSIVGTIGFAFTIETGVVIITNASLEVSPSGSSSTYEVTATDLVIDPASNGSFIPESGTITFGVPNTGPGPETIDIVVTFSAQSPADGTVQVQVGGASSVTYQIPGL